MRIKTSIFELQSGSVAVVAGYSRVYGGYVGKLISKGLEPGTSFVVLNLAKEGNVQVMLLDKIITLSKPEVNALCIDLSEEEL
ncbi:ferrous iron transport protein A [Pleurocapsales cyanobacterium LEGE 10410]|nr:ferrous iron transport protein A [Pleurocapsales cyanobacterium LEGE 10410]